MLRNRGVEHMRTLPQVNSLREAVQTVIFSNKKDGYSPTRFIKMTAVSDSELTNVCSNLITKPGSLIAIYEAISGMYPDLLTIEDFISIKGDIWGFHSEIIDEAKQRSMLFNEWAKKTRYNINLK